LALRRVLVFGNSGSGKSTLAKKIAKQDGLSYLDLDTLAWLPTRLLTTHSMKRS